MKEFAIGSSRAAGPVASRHRGVLAARRGSKRAIVAGARKMPRIAYVGLETGGPCYDRTADCDALMVAHNAPR